MEIQGTLVVTALMALVGVFLVQGVKLALGKEWAGYWRYIPIPLALVMIGIGVLLAYLQGEDLVAGGINGFVAGAFSAFGYDLLKGIFLRKEV